MTTILNHDIRSVNGKYLVMPPWKEGQSGWGNLSIPNPCLAGGDTSQQYPANTKFVDFDRTFIYGYMNSKFSSAVKANVGLFNQNPKETITWGATVGVAGDTLVGILASTLDVQTTAAANVFAGGYLMPRTNPYSDYRIISNTAYNGGRVSGEMDIVIENGLVAAVTASQTSCFLDRNPYTKMRSNWAGGNDYESVIGVTLIDPTAATYQWVQTWGPCHVPSDENLGASANIRTCWWHIDGSVRAGAGYVPATTQQQQYAGHCLGCTMTDSTYAASWFIRIELER